MRSTSESLDATSASRVGSSIAVPSAAAVIGSVIVTSRSSPCRVKTGCRATSISTYRSPAGPPPGPTSPSPVELDAGAGVDARRDLDVDGATSPDPAVAGALRARIGDDGAEAAAGGAGRIVRTSPRNDRWTWLISPRPEHVVQVAVDVPGAVPAPLHSVQVTAVSTLISFDDPERRLAEVELEPDQRVLAAAGARTWAARPGALPEERVHDVGEREALAEAAGSRRGQRVAAEVVHLPLLGVAQHVVRPRDLLEPLLGGGVRVDVGVQLAGQLAVGLLDLLGTRVARDAEDFVQVVGHAPGIVRVGVVRRQASDRIWLT